MGTSDVQCRADLANSFAIVSNMFLAPATPRILRRLANAAFLLAERTDLGVQGSVMAPDRTLMAWIRTALSMISFGFTIYQLLEGFQRGGGALPHENSPRNVGLFLTGLGTVSMVMGTIEYWQTLKQFHKLRRFPIWRASSVIALIMSIAGLLLFVSIISKVL